MSGLLVSWSALSNVEKFDVHFGCFVSMEFGLVHWLRSLHLRDKNGMVVLDSNDLG